MLQPGSIGDPYAILGVDRDADDQAIAAAYKRLARQFHPDVAGEAATSRMMRINAAFETIRTAERRGAYERAITPGRPRPATADGVTSAGARDALRWRPPDDGTGGAGPPPGRPSGSVIDFGRHVGWSIGEIARVDPGYLVWLEERREGRPYAAEIDRTLRRMGLRGEEPSRTHQPRSRRGFFGRS
jgi:curved DNA-binding protein CbpA